MERSIQCIVSMRYKRDPNKEHALFVHGFNLKLSVFRLYQGLTPVHVNCEHTVALSKIKFVYDNMVVSNFLGRFLCFQAICNSFMGLNISKVIISV